MALDENGNVIPDESVKTNVSDTTQTALTFNDEEQTDDAGKVTDRVATEEGALDNVTTATGNYRALAQGAATSGESDFASYDSPGTALAGLTPGEAGDYQDATTSVANQFEKLMAKDNPLRIQARKGAREQASALGMLSSSAAIGATRGVDVNAMAKMASQDAETASKFALQEQQAYNKINEIQVEAEVSGELTVQKAKISERQNQINQEWDAMIKAADAETQVAFTELKQRQADNFKRLEADLQAELAQQEIDAGVEQQIVNNASNAMNEYQVSVQQMLSSESFLELFGNNRTKMNEFFDDMFVGVQSSIAFQAKAASVYGEPGGDGLYDFVQQLGEDNAWA